MLLDRALMLVFLFTGDYGVVKEKAGGDSSYEEALSALSSLITKRSRADKSNKGDRFELVFDYLKVSLLRLKI